MPQIDLRLGIHVGLALVAVAIGAAIAFAFYRSTVPPVPRGRRILLSILRALALALLILLLADPILQLLYRSATQPTLTVLVDNSKSMTLPEHNGARADIVRSLLHSPTLDGLRSRATVRIVPFGSSTRITEQPGNDSLSFSEDGTDIAGALGAAQERDQMLHSNAVLLLTDGIVTLGQSPLQLASTFPVPITTVAIGDSSERMDLVLQRLAANSIVYSGSTSPVQAVIHASGYKDQHVEVTLTDGSTFVGRSTLALEPGSRDYAVPFSWTPTGEGTHTLTASVGNLPGELTTQNNRRSVSVRVRKSKLKIMVVAGAPSHDLAFFRSTTAEDSNTVVTTFTQTPTGAFYEGTLAQQSLDSADCIVLVGFPTAATLPRSVDAITASAGNRHRPLLWIASRTVDFRHANALSSLLPFTAPQISSAEQEISVEPGQSEASNALLGPSTGEQRLDWRQLPPVFVTNTPFVPKAGTQTLATMRISGVATPLPALVALQQPHRRSLAILCYGIWRWRLLAQRSPEVAGYFPRLVSNMLRWLTSPDDASALTVRPTMPVFGQGESISFEAQAYDVQQKPVENAQIAVTVIQRDRTTEGVFTSVGNGRYEGSLPGIAEEGVFRFRAQATRDGITLGADSGMVRVGGTHVEFLATETQTPLLRAIAARSGGVCLLPDQFDRLPDELARQGFFAPRETTRGTELQLRSWPLLAAAVILLLAIEWLIRKRSGMI
jgi:hypothetical protein